MRREYFSAVIEYLNISPVDFPEPLNRKKRKIEILMPAPPDPPKLAIMSKADLKAQKKRDRYLLNVLKLRIQPIMDQIKMKFKKFRTGVIDESQIKYLYDEDDPAMVSTDLPTEQRRQAQYRPFEKGVDEHGAPGLVETETGKFFYNLEIVTIERRLSNGYYKRPKDFLSDIKKLTKDAKSIGDQERLLKANELQANVEVDIQGIEIGEAATCADLEAVYERETKREKEMLEKAKELAPTESQRLEMVSSNVPPGNAGLPIEQSSGPIILGQPVINGVVHHPVTPSNPSQPSQQSNLTNGLSGRISDLSDLHGRGNESNGNSVPSQSQSDPHVTSEGPSERETQNSSFGPSAQTQHPTSYTGGLTNLQQRMSVPGSLSQRSAITPMAEGSNPHDYANYASTTSSEKPILGSSGLFNTPSSHAKGDGLDLDPLPETIVSNSQLPDTQGTSSSSEYRNSRNLTTPSASQNTSNFTSSQSQNNSQHSQNPAVPPFPRPSNPHASIHSLLNNDAPSKPSTSVSHLVIDLKLSDQFLEEIVVQSRGCSVEQLEQIYSALMDKIWKTRGDWNRARVTRELKDVFEDVLDDIKGIQETASGSLEIEG